MGFIASWWLKISGLLDLKSWGSTSLFVLEKFLMRFKKPLPEEVRAQVLEKLKNGYYIILTRAGHKPVTYLVMFLNVFLTGKMAYWVHSLMNTEDTVKTESDLKLIFIEAATSGVVFSLEDNVFDKCDSICLLRPKSLTREEWTQVLEKSKSYLGKPYDSLFNLMSENKINCVELIRDALMTLPDYAERFREFESMINRQKNLHPQTFYDCSEFVVEFEYRR